MRCNSYTWQDCNLLDWVIYVFTYLKRILKNDETNKLGTDISNANLSLCLRLGAACSLV